MMVCRRISTFSCSATASALRSGRTLKPIMIAFEADASSTSDSLIAPTPEWITRTLTFSFESFCSVSVSTSADPPTSVLMMIGSSLTSPDSICLWSCSRVRRLDFASAASRAFWSRKLTICLALAVSVTTWKSSPGFRQRFEAEYFDRGRGLRLADLRAAVVLHGAHFAEYRTADEEVADVQRAVAHQHGGDRTAAAVELSFDHGTHGRAARVGFEILHIGHQEDHLEQQIEMVMGFGGDLNHDGVAAPILRQQAAVGQLLLDALGLGVGLVDLVDRHEDRHLGGARVVDGFERLRHDAVVGRHHQDDDVGDLGAAGAHAGECFVAGRVDEDDLAAVHLHLVGADVLGDAAGFAGGHVGFADGVEQRRLAVVDVAHDGDHRSALEQILGVLGDLHGLHGLFFVADGSGGSAELARHFGGQFGIERLVDGHEDAAVHQLLHHQGGLHIEFLGKLLDGDAFGNGDLAVDRRRTGLHMPALRPKDSFFFHALARLRAAGPLVAGAAARLFHRRRRQPGLHAAAGCRMLRARSGRTARGWSARPCAGSRHQRLAGADGPAIDRLSGNRCRGGFRDAGPGRGGRGRHGRPGRGKLGCEVRPRRNDRTGRGLARQGLGRGRSRRALGRRTLPGFRTPGGDRLPLKISRCASRSRTHSFGACREGLPRTRENLAGARRCGLARYGTRPGHGRPARRDHGRGRHR